MSDRFAFTPPPQAFSKNPLCPVCKRKTAEETAQIYLDTKLTGYFVVLITFKETFLRFPACAPCRRRVGVDDMLNRNGAALICGAVVAVLIGLMMIALEIPSVLSGDYSSLFHSPVVGLVIAAPAVVLFWQCFRSRRNVSSYLAALGYQKENLPIAAANRFRRKIR